MEDLLSTTPCFTCVSVDQPLFSIMNCVHSKFLNKILTKFKIELSSVLLCLGCHDLLKKVDLFQKRVEESCKYFSQGSLKRDLFDSIRYTNKYNLGLSEIINKVSLPENFDYSIKEEELDATMEDTSMCFDVDLKLGAVKPENLYLKDDSNSDTCLDNLKVSDLFVNRKPKKRKTQKRQKVPKKNLHKAKLKNSNRTAVSNDNHIKMIILSEEELLEERKRETENPNYVKFTYKCRTCVLGFDYERTYQDHMDKRHNVKDGTSVCGICSSVLKHASFNLHYKRHYIRYECTVCGRRMVHKESMEWHYVTMHGTGDRAEEQITCDLCGFVSKSRRSHRYHKEKKHKSHPQCAYCGRTFINKSILLQHIMNIHSPERTFPCDECDKVYRGKSGLVMHKLTHKPTDSAAYCQTCRVQFKTMYNYRNHLKTSSKHTNDDDKKFVCEDCGAKFIRKTNLEEHMDRVHLKVYRHSCHVCNKKFARLLGLNKHIKYVHEKKRPPRDKICDHCGRGFTTNQILACHIRTHTGERPLQCAHCPATFAHSASLYTHNKLLHKHKSRDLGDT